MKQQALLAARFSALLLGLLQMCVAQGATIYARTPTLDGNVISDSNSIFSISATQFSLGAGDTVRSVIWRGSGNVAAANNQTIAFYNDAGGNVGSLIGSFNVGVPLSSTSLGISFGGASMYEFVADLGSGIALPSGDLWVAIYGNSSSSSSGDDWTWGRDDFSGTSIVSQSPNGGATWNVNANTFDFYFVLDNTNAVPIPAAVWLFGSALGLLGLIKRRL